MRYQAVAVVSEVDRLSHICSFFAGYRAPNCCASTFFIFFFLSNVSTIIAWGKKLIKMYQTVSSLVL